MIVGFLREINILEILDFSKSADLHLLLIYKNGDLHYYKSFLWINVFLFIYRFLENTLVL